MSLNRFVNQHDFARVPRANIPRSVFDRSHTYKTTFDSGYLIPVLCEEVLPADTFTLKASFFARLATPAVPIMDNLWLDSFFFFVPNRLVWHHWQNMMGEQESPDDSIDYTMPIMNTGTGVAVHSIYDYFGIPTGIANLDFTSLPLRCYNLIYQEWFKDENLIDAPALNKGDTQDPLTDYTLRRRGKRHDYFTSCLPWPQKGEGVEISLGGNAPLVGNPIVGIDPVVNGVVSVSPSSGTWRYHDFGSSFTPVHQYSSGFSNNSEIGKLVFSGAHNGIQVSPTSSSTQVEDTSTFKYPFNWNGAYADMSSASPITINTFRQAFQMQKFLEAQARGGSRYIEQIRQMFGVISPDARLQRPEYLGGSSSRITINPVAQTSGTQSSTGAQQTPQGNLAAYGVTSDVFHGFTKSFVEHGYIIGLVSVRADLTYQQGLNRMWSRKTRFDFYWPVFAHLGEQAVLNKEIYAQGKSVLDLQENIVDEKVFGYQERYAEYRYSPSMITGKFRSTYETSLDVWHLSQKFDSLPLLNQTFIEENPPISRVVAVQDEPQFLFDAYFQVKACRPLPLFGVPGLVDHF